MKININLQTVILTLLCLLGASDIVQAAWHEPYGKTTTVMQGTSLGKISLGMSPQQVRRILGKPTSQEKTCDLWFEYSDDEIPAMQTSELSFIVVNYTKGKVVQIAARLRKAVTKDNFGMHSTLSQIQRRFKNIKRSSTYEVVDVKEIFYSSKALGIGFSFTSESGKILGSDEPGCFIIFRPGHTIIPSWFSDNTIHPH